MSLAPQELENTASKYASEAIKFDSQGARGMAITHYQHAIDSLVNFLQFYPGLLTPPPSPRDRPSSRMPPSAGKKKLERNTSTIVR